jgi:hypothetical protein
LFFFLLHKTNQERTIQSHRQHWVHKTKDEDKNKQTNKTKKQTKNNSNKQTKKPQHNTVLKVNNYDQHEPYQKLGVLFVYTGKLSDLSTPMLAFL